MSKLYEILRQIENREREGPRFPSSGAKPGVGRRWSWVGLLLLGLFSALGSFWAFRLWYTSTPSPGPVRPPIHRSFKVASAPSPERTRKKKAASSPRKTASLPEKRVVLPAKKPLPPPAKTRVSSGGASPGPSPVRRSGERLLLSPAEVLRGYLVRAEILRHQGRCAEALDYYRRYLARFRDPGVLNNYGACLWLLGRLSEAREAFRESLRLKEDPEVRLNLVLLSLKMGDKREACAAFRPLRGKGEAPDPGLEAYLRKVCGRKK
ncbi:MAG TPA: tetratricopeptide repeat protein [Thermosulfurimonas dismutans]|uniref:Tetratricopeptide repeat protein n=1 Tax=Thermosulfurimonas dismutans TaxID=999894 RepID=A0A7C3GJQ3_9BACT|nr:tetratricopeptide repeat protein [Thermosulfurimonas dismutans]